MRRSIGFFLLVALLVAAAVWLAQNPGTVAVEWMGYVVEARVWVFVLAATVLALLIALVLRLVTALLRSPAAMRRLREKVKRDQGYKALTRGMVAVAAGDADAARLHARKAEGLLDAPPLTLLLSAQAAQLEGDEQAAAGYFRAMLDRGDTAFLGLRGLLVQALKAGDTAAALDLAKKALALQPKAKWPNLAVIDLSARSGLWTEAREAVEAAKRVKALEAPDAKRRQAALLVEDSRKAQGEGKTEVALTAAQKAHDLCPGFVPAAAQLARLKGKAGQAKAATRTLEQAWKLSPHPELAQVWGEVAGTADSLALVKRYEALVAVNPSAQAAHLALARASIAAKLWGEARNHLNLARTLAPTAAVIQLFADLARAEHGEGAEMREWLAKLPGADPDPAWTCTVCGTPHGTWRAVCGHCGSFATLDWQVPGRRPLPAADLILLPPGAMPATLGLATAPSLSGPGHRG